MDVHLNAEIIAHIQQSNETPVTRIDSQSRLHHYYIVPARLVAPKPSTLRTVSRRIVPASFIMLVLFTGTTFLIYTLVLHQSIQSIPVIAVSVVFASIIILYLLTLIAVYFRERRAQSRTNIESQNEQASTGIQESFRKLVMKYHKKLRDRYRSTYQESTEKKPFLGSLQERWFTWIGSHLQFPDGSIFRSIWRRNRQGSIVTMSTGSSEPAAHS
jgi:hypothetical protein